VELDAGVVAAAAELPTLVASVLAAGFGSAEVDERGFRSGSLNERLPDPGRYR
jgi:uncharacterized protein